MKKIYSFIFTLLFKHFLRVTAKEENKTTWQTNLYYMYFCRKCLYFTSFLFKGRKNKRRKTRKKKAGALIKWCLTCDIRVGSSKDMELPFCENSGEALLEKHSLRTQEKHPFRKSEKLQNWCSQAWQEQQLAGWRGRGSSGNKAVTTWLSWAIPSIAVECSSTEPRNNKRLWTSLCF